MAGKDKLDSLLKELYRKGQRLPRRSAAEWHYSLTLPRLADEEIEVEALACEPALSLQSEAPACPNEGSLAAYADGSLDDELREFIGKHLGECSECREIISQLKETRSAKIERPPSRLLSRLKKEIE